MRRVILDTETTGLDHRTGDRVIEIGCVEMIGRRLTGVHFHKYLNPERDIDPGAVKVHGLTAEFLADKPRFADIAGEFIEFVRGAELVIHNAAFDIGFLNHELELIEQENLERLCRNVVDTLHMARELRPGKKNNLNALCSEFGIDNSGRQLHGALLDAELLAEVYLAMTRGQNSLAIEFAAPTDRPLVSGHERAPLVVLQPTAEELNAHEQVLEAIARESKGVCLWRQLPGAGG